MEKLSLLQKSNAALPLGNKKGAQVVAVKAASEVLQASNDLTEKSGELQGLVKTYLGEIKAA